MTVKKNRHVIGSGQCQLNWVHHVGGLKSS
uniref:Uncharacterized protein n=1 Tax=Arundo donax TaxID=35708 RepID=A0A0A9AXY6_ARUDO